MAQWIDDLSEYLDHLEATAAELASTVLTARGLTVDGAFASLPEANIGIQNGLVELENCVERRRELLDRDDSPGNHYTLRAALQWLANEPAQYDDAHFLLERTQAIGIQIEKVREDALALFVCQYHLADTTSHFLRLIMPAAEVTDTYSQKSGLHHGGGLLDQAG